MLLPSSKPLENLEKYNITAINSRMPKTSRSSHHTETNCKTSKLDRWGRLWWHLDYVTVAGYKKIYSTRCCNRCQQSVLPCECLLPSFFSQENEWGGPAWWNPDPGAVAVWLGRLPSPACHPPLQILQHALIPFSASLIKAKCKLGKTEHILNPLEGRGMETASSTVLLNR